jgi:gamma-glutamyltranspeptidase/glutathione hydrolase
MRKFLLLLLVFNLFFGCSIKQQTKYSPDNWIGEPDSGLQKTKLVKANKFMISSAHELASKAGERILEKGGNAIDAAIAAQMVLNVVEPHSSGIGGGAFLLYYDAKKKKMLYFNGREIAPENVKSDMFLDQNKKAKKFSDAVRGGYSVGVPGLLKMLKIVHQKYGKIAWQELFNDAIEIAQNGFLVSERLNNLTKKISYLKDFDQSAEIYFNEKKQPKKIGETIINRKLADTFKIIAKEGIEPFYHGKIAGDIVEAVQNSKINPGFLSLNDLKNYQIRKGDLICLKYRKKYKICTMPFPSGGVTLLQIFGILENFNLKKIKPNSFESIHLISEATRLAYADRNQYVGDYDSKLLIRKMLDKKYLKERAKLIDRNFATKNFPAGEFLVDKNLVNEQKSFEKPSTTHLSIIDRDGNAIALTSSIEYFFGSAISVDGFLLNNQLTDFSFYPEIDGKKIANAIEPKKQPRSSMSPAFVFDEKDKLIMIVGSPGGPRIIQFTLKTIVNYLDFNLDLQQSISIPNFAVIDNVIELEKNTDLINLQKDLEKIGHQVKIVEIVSGINAISIKNKKIYAVADPRREGVALGL